jgi:dienelactone hydrolase
MTKLLLIVAVIFTAAIFAIPTVGTAADVQKKDVTLKTPDGVTLKGTYMSPGGSGPAILLLHQCNMDRHAWDGFAGDLANAGFHVLTFDFRGYGDSGGKLTDADARRKQQQEKWPGDVDAAYAYLLSQSGVDKSRVAVGGASCGVGQASALASRRHEIKALMLLSGNASDAAKDYIAKTTSLPVFGAASEDDKGPAQGIKDALGASRNPQSVLKIVSGTEHGVPMFAKHSDLEPMIVNWLKTQLGLKGTS